MGDNTQRPRAGRLLTGALAGTVAVVALPAGVAIGTTTAATAFFAGGVLTVNGDAADNTLTVSRNAAGTLLVNGGAVPVAGGTPTVANTSRIVMSGLGGNDRLTLDEVNGPLPRSNQFGGAGNDVLTGGSGGDQIFGQAGNDTVNSRGGFDLVFGGTENDVLTGGSADDQVFGESGNDRLVWNPGDGTDLNEGGAGEDTTEVNGGGGAEQFALTANGTRVRFDRLNPAPFAIDIGSTERLTLNANGGDDSFSATGNLAALIRVTADGGAGNDVLLGTNGIDLLLGGAGSDFVDGQQGNDVGFLGAGDDTFQWDPGDGSDTVEGQDGADVMLFNGSGGNERMSASANGGRILFRRDLGNIVMDTDDVERIDVGSRGGADEIVVNDVSGTDLTEVRTDLSALGDGGAADASTDTVVATGTNGDDQVFVSGSGSQAEVTGLSARIRVIGAEPGADRVTVNARAGDDVVQAFQTAAGAALLVLNGEAGNDVLIGGDGPDVLTGGDGDDVLLGGDGDDSLDGGPGDDVLIGGDGNDIEVDGLVAGRAWLASHTRTSNGRTTLVAPGGPVRLGF
jgi:Ca2+-binding RTX toxin-like protein